MLDKHVLELVKEYLSTPMCFCMFPKIGHMKTLVFTGFHKANVEKHMGFEALNGTPGPKHCVLPHFIGEGGVG